MAALGYAPRRLCTLSTPESLGRIIVLHEPSEHALPVRPGKYQVVIGAAISLGFLMIQMRVLFRVFLVALTSPYRPVVDLI